MSVHLDLFQLKTFVEPLLSGARTWVLLDPRINLAFLLDITALGTESIITQPHYFRLLLSMLNSFFVYCVRSEINHALWPLKKPNRFWLSSISFFNPCPLLEASICSSNYLTEAEVVYSRFNPGLQQTPVSGLFGLSNLRCLCWVL